jgi:Asp-tRNA(Asn)/Glu-tRNA(Gln) amidotransferase A subunit family amidase
VPDNLAERGATELVALFRGKKASPVEAGNAARARIEACDGVLDAFRLVDAARALASADAALMLNVFAGPDARDWQALRAARAFEQAHPITGWIPGGVS